MTSTKQSNKTQPTIRQATEADVPLILQFIQELAEYEKLAHQVTATEVGLRQSLFGPRPYAEVIFVEVAEEAVGFALFFHNFSTFVGKPGLYLEDLFVKPSHRGQGLGRLLLAYLAHLAVTRDCGRLEWAVLNWNELALRTYRAIGATPLAEWTGQRLSGTALQALAQSFRDKPVPVK